MELMGLDIWRTASQNMRSLITMTKSRELGCRRREETCDHDVLRIVQRARFIQVPGTRTEGILGMCAPITLLRVTDLMRKKKYRSKIAREKAVVAGNARKHRSRGRLT
jgi:hypothetical protein